MTTPGPASREGNREVLACPLSTCPWTYELKIPRPDVRSLVKLFSRGEHNLLSMEAVRYLDSVEKTLSNHLETHDITQWLKDLQDARATIAEQAECIHQLEMEVGHLRAI